MSARIALGVALWMALASSAAAKVGEIVWADWTKGTPGSPGSAAGTIQAGSRAVGVEYSGRVLAAATGYSGDYWRGDAYTVAGSSHEPPGSDVIMLDASETPQTISFSEPVRDPVLAILSLGNPSRPVQYVFDAPFALVSHGRGYFGNGKLEALPGNVLQGAEGHGLIQFAGTFRSISWTVKGSETWHGIQVGISPLPPESSCGMGWVLILLLAGLVAGRVWGIRRRRSGAATPAAREP